MGRAYAGILGPLAFATMLVRGLLSGSHAEPTLITATLCLFTLSAVGFLVGQIADMIVLESVRKKFDEGLKAYEQIEPAEAAQ